jgi:hypothetical protein
MQATTSELRSGGAFRRRILLSLSTSGQVCTVTAGADRHACMHIAGKCSLQHHSDKRTRGLKSLLERTHGVQLCTSACTTNECLCGCTYPETSGFSGRLLLTYDHGREVPHSSPRVPSLPNTSSLLTSDRRFDPPSHPTSPSSPGDLLPCAKHCCPSQRSSPRPKRRRRHSKGCSVHDRERALHRTHARHV